MCNAFKQSKCGAILIMGNCLSESPDWCQKKRWQELKGSSNVIIISLFRSND